MIPANPVPGFCRHDEVERDGEREQQRAEEQPPPNQLVADGRHEGDRHNHQPDGQPEVQNGMRRRWHSTEPIYVSRRLS